MRHVSPEALDTARQMRAEGKSWDKIGRALGFTPDVIRWRIDPAYIAKNSRKYAGPHSMIRASVYRPSETEIHNLRQTVPPDTRSFTSRAMGDPLPGRSALDKRQALKRESTLSTNPAACSRSVHYVFDGRGEAEDIRDRPNSGRAV